uniref:Uncharacterized protein LOC104222680 n=1 Tax=Nicotiana sylvestris TaxID=4096 RepID=A0A1U7WDE6_NICSY|nr:PREDICTED: uncharacterized protein LOC104222680 [Nicotiana sylvestris]
MSSKAQQKKLRTSRIITADDRTKNYSTRRICKILELDNKAPFIRFGPVFGQDDVQIQTAKDESWQHVVRSNQDSSKATTTEIYMSAIREIEKEARDSYDFIDPKLTKIPGQQFRWMMIKDGCFFLQLSFSLLGVHDNQLELKQHSTSSGLNKYKCVASMFHVGNQIPLVVLRQLLEQKHFQNLIKDGKWEPPTSDLAKMTLFHVLISPMLERRRLIRIPSNPFLRGIGRRLKQIWMHQGIRIIAQKEDENEDEDDDYDDYDTAAAAADNDNGVRRHTSAEMKPKVKNATKLKQSGIHFRVIKKEGIRGIRFKSYLFYPHLSLPPLFVGSHTQLLLKNLKRYEISQKFDSNRREVSSYLQFMCDLIRTSEDVKLLALGGIIKGNRKYTEKLPKILRNLASNDRRDDTSLNLVKVQINSYYRPPWVTQFGQYLTLVFLLTFVQTIYAILAYHKPPKDKK